MIVQEFGTVVVNEVQVESAGMLTMVVHCHQAWVSRRWSSNHPLHEVAQIAGTPACTRRSAPLRLTGEPIGRALVGKNAANHNELLGEQLLQR